MLFRRASLADGYVGLLCVAVLEFIASIAVVAVIINVLGKVRKPRGSTKAGDTDVEGGIDLAGI